MKTLIISFALVFYAYHFITIKADYNNLLDNEYILVYPSVELVDTLQSTYALKLKLINAHFIHASTHNNQDVLLVKSSKNLMELMTIPLMEVQVYPNTQVTYSASASASASESTTKTKYYYLDRISNHSPHKQSKDYTLTQTNVDTSNVTVYLLDSGITLSSNLQPFVSLGDENGHGTSVAHIIRQITLNATLVSVPITTSTHPTLYSVYLALVQTYSHIKRSFTKSIVNLSFSMHDQFNLIDEMVDELIGLNATVVAAQTKKTCHESPKKVKGVILVGGIDESNKGVKSECVDLYAPSKVESIDKDGQQVQVNGVSFSTAIVSGVAAQFLVQIGGKSVKDAMKRVASKVKVDGKSISIVFNQL